MAESSSDHRPHHGHNHSHADHLQSNFHVDIRHEQAEELKQLATSFVDGFRHADDKTSYLRLSQIPFNQKGQDGLTLNLVDASITSNWQIGTASPAFASRELNYMPFPGTLVTKRETMTFTYVSLTERRNVDLIDILKNRLLG